MKLYVGRARFADMDRLPGILIDLRVYALAHQLEFKFDNRLYGLEGPSVQEQATLAVMSKGNTLLT